MARINIVRVHKNVVRIACLHFLHSAVSTTAIKFWYGKIKLWYEFWAQLFGQHTKKSPHGTHAARFIQTWRRKSIRWVTPHKKRTSELGYDQYDQQRSINLFHWCVLEISQFYLCFLTLIEHFYMPPLFFFGVYALSKLRSIVSYFMTLRRSSLVSVFFQDTPRDF